LHARRNNDVNLEEGQTGQHPAVLLLKNQKPVNKTKISKGENNENFNDTLCSNNADVHSSGNGG
jgi:hypothetical protein